MFPWVWPMQVKLLSIHYTYLPLSHVPHSVLFIVYVFVLNISNVSTCFFVCHLRIVVCNVLCSENSNSSQNMPLRLMMTFHAETLCLNWKIKKPLCICELWVISEHILKNNFTNPAKNEHFGEDVRQQHWNYKAKGPCWQHEKPFVLNAKADLLSQKLTDNMKNNHKPYVRLAKFWFKCCPCWS